MDTNTIMHIDAETTLLEGAEYCSSPHFNHRPPNATINLVVLHCASLPYRQFGGPGIDDLFSGRLNADNNPYGDELDDFRVAPHLLIRRQGQLIQYVPFSERAWHAGVSCFKGQTACNDFSIGIELEGAEDVPYEDVQYDVLANVSRVLMRYYPDLETDRIVGHSDIAPGRRVDPGPAFDWNHFHLLLQRKRNGD